MGTEGVERSRDFERVITFVDAIVAIAITLLVLPLVDVAAELGTGSVTDLLREHLTQIGAFLLSFVVIANAWISQHRVVGPVIASSPLLIRLLLLWTLTIVILPFPTALVAQSGHQPATKLLYIGTMTLTSAVLTVICWAVGRDRAIRDGEAKPDVAHAAGSTLAFLAALALSLLIPSLSYYPLLLLLLPGPLLALWHRRLRNRRGSEPVPSQR